MYNINKKSSLKRGGGMGANYSEIQELLQQRADIQARLKLMP